MKRWKVVGLAVPMLIGTLVLAAAGQSGPIPSAPTQIRPILIGSEAPGPVLKNAAGEDVDLSRLLEQQPTILVFYRAHWCPHCRRQLVQLQEDAATLDSLGYRIIAICIDPPEKLAESKLKWGVDFLLLSDPDLKAAHSYGVAFRPEGKTGLPVPAVFIIDTDRHVQFQYVNPKYQVRLGRQVLLAAARELVSE